MEVTEILSESVSGKYHQPKAATYKSWEFKLQLLLKKPSVLLKLTPRKKLTRPPRAELDQWAQSLEKLLEYKSGVSAFREFLKSEFCEENIEFWLACEDFKLSKTPENLLTKAESIYEEFICMDSPKEVNLDFHTRSRIKQHLPHPTLNCFDEAQRKIYQLMENDCYTRFLESGIYQALRGSERPRRP
ncbi:regulator of G-protein signaling 21-like [Brachyhypopomus gauderio]|uniref:regulator of G-protein signaling 21-like n=1 Tax=Brachyhypopomus gauderio TaxID=698409 RepID=UPI004042E866